MRLTAEVVNNARSYRNPLGERELDLRGKKISSIENLGVAKVSPGEDEKAIRTALMQWQDQEAIDFTENDITILGNFPLSPRLQTLLCARNRISSIETGLGKSIPNLHTLSLSYNDFVELADLYPLKEFPKLTHLDVIVNPVTKKENYRDWVIWLVPQVRFFDHQKVKDAERKKAKELFGTSDAPTKLAQGIIAAHSSKPLEFNDAPMANGTGKSGELKLSETEKKRIQDAINNVSSMTEVQKLETALSEGRLPRGMSDAEAMDQT